MNEGLRRGASTLVLLAILVALCFPVVALLTRFDVLHFRSAFAVLGGLAVCGAILFMLSGFAFVMAQHEQGEARDRRLPLVAILVLLVPLGFVAQAALTAKRVPYLHDVSTDPDNPPQFVHAPSLRTDAENDLVYTQENAQLQRQGYPEIVPLMLPGTLSTVLTQVQAAVRQLGWELTYVDQEQGGLEATDTSFWFGFVDDIVVRLREDVETGSVQVDVRSVSRVGKSDLGMNAKRITRLLAALQNR